MDSSGIGRAFGGRSLSVQLVRPRLSESRSLQKTLFDFVKNKKQLACREW